MVATSSLDLGVDFLPVERVLQIGSAKGVARLLQRAGRSGHAPGRASRITLVPTNTLELVEAAAARRAALAGNIEKRATHDKPFDVLVQHLVTVALGGGFRDDELFEEVKGAWAYRKLARAEFQWALDFVVKGGSSLHAYPEYHRVVEDAEGVYRVPNRMIARRHKLNVGTIVSDSSMQVKYLTGGRIGVVEEGFVARLRKGDCFVFAGRTLEFVRAEEMTAYVKRADGKKAFMIAWAGAKMPLSSELADSVMEVLADAAEGDFIETRDGGRAADARDPGAALAHSHAEDAAHREARFARRPASVPLSVRRAQRRTSAWAACSPGGSRGTSRTPSASSSTTTGSSC